MKIVMDKDTTFLLAAYTAWLVKNRVLRPVDHVEPRSAMDLAQEFARSLEVEFA